MLSSRVLSKRFFLLPRLRPGAKRSYANSKYRYKDHGAAALKKFIPVELYKTDGEPASLLFEAMFLRDSCSCPMCVDHSTKQRLFETADIPLDIEVKEVRSVGGNGVQIHWEKDMLGYNNHVSEFAPDTLEMISNSQTRIHERTYASRFAQILWGQADEIRDHNPISYDCFTHSQHDLYNALKVLQVYGIIFIKDVPSDPVAIQSIAEKIGPIRNTFYGPTWDVRSVPSAKNVAYTSQNLGFHMDLLYMAEPPGLQLLHCMKQSTEGGETLFSDGFRALDQLCHDDFGLASTLKTFPVTYRYKNDGHWYENTKTTVEGNIGLSKQGIFTPTSSYKIQGGGEAAINWSPPFQGPFQVDIGESFVKTGSNPSKLSRLRLFVTAAKKFKALLEAPKAILEKKLEEGTCVIFNNRRILHARKGFSSEGGERWLRGAYIDTDAFRSRLRMLGQELGGDSTAT